MFSSLTLALIALSTLPAALAAPALSLGKVIGRVSTSISADLVLGSAFYKKRYGDPAFRALYPGQHVFGQVNIVGNVLPNSRTEPLSCLFPLTSTLGYKISPIIDGLLGHKADEHIDTAADALCIAAARDSSGGGGVCQNLLDAIDDVVQYKAGSIFQTHSALGKLLNLLCVAQNTNPSTEVCQFAFAGIDCNANRLIGAEDFECTLSSG